MPTKDASYLRELGVFGFDDVEVVILAALVTEDPLLLIGRSGTGEAFLLNSLSEALGLEHPMRDGRSTGARSKCWSTPTARIFAAGAMATTARPDASW